MTVLLSLNQRHITFVRYFLRKINRGLYLKKFWKLYKGNLRWGWVQEQPTSIATLNRNLWRMSVPSFSFHFILGLSAIIATLGLLADSAAVIIGAMIIAPLMGPILGIAYATAVGNRKLLRRSSLTVLGGVILTIMTAWITSSIIGLKTVDTEIMSRVNPTLIDFGIAMAAGTAGAFANTRRSISNTLPGVAIAIALVPPLSVVGIGLSLGEQSISTDAFLLFLTNLICIIFFGALVFLFQSYGSIERAKKGLAMSTAVMFLLGFPLTLSMRELIVKKNVRSQIRNLIVYETETFNSSDIKSLTVTPKPEYLEVVMQVVSTNNSVSQSEIERMRNFLSHQIDEPINLRVEVIPVKVLESTNNS